MLFKVFQFYCTIQTYTIRSVVALSSHGSQFSVQDVASFVNALAIKKENEVICNDSTFQ